MTRYYTYNEFFELLARELRQLPEDGDLNPKKDVYRTCGFEEGKFHVNTILRTLCNENPFLFENFFTYTFTSSTKKLLLPENICKALYYKNKSGIFTDLQDYISSGNYTGSNYGVYSYSANELYNPEGWNLGDELELKAIIYPDEISYATPAELADTSFSESEYTGSGDEIKLPKEFVRYLILLIKRRVISKQQGTDISQADQIELAEEAARFRTFKGKTKRVFQMGFKGLNFGR